MLMDFELCDCVECLAMEWKPVETDEELWIDDEDDEEFEIEELDDFWKELDDDDED
jgi:hypothetical protein